MKVCLPLLLIFAATGTTRAAPPRYLGVASCTGLACHGGPAQSGAHAGLNSYTVWATQDPHADAGITLLTDRSQQIVRNLRGAETSPAEHRRVLADRCMGCHATPARYDLAEGVSCEACHGPAGDWIEPHTRASWTKLTPQEKLSHGMVDLQPLRPRAEVCVRCHVGPVFVDGKLHDVNHDLIAAGHPLLAFEFSAYLAQMPHHWDAAQDRRRTEEFDRAAWTAGQLANARAGLELLLARADPAKEGVWPELAEFDCAACHHPLRSKYAARSGEGRPSQLVWRTWNYASLLPGWESGRELLASSSLERARVASLATRGLADLAQLDASAVSINLEDAPKHWEQAAQAYLAAAALSGSYDVADPQLQQALAAFRARLEQPGPYALDPDHPQFRRAWDELRKHLP